MTGQQHEIRAKKAKMAISYIMFGTLMVIWSLVWLAYLLIPSDVSGSVYLAAGTVLSGLAVAAIGFSVGRVGKEANSDEDEHDEARDVRTPPPTEADVATMTKNTPPLDVSGQTKDSERPPAKHNASVS